MKIRKSPASEAGMTDAIRACLRPCRSRAIHLLCLGLIGSAWTNRDGAARQSSVCRQSSARCNVIHRVCVRSLVADFHLIGNNSFARIVVVVRPFVLCTDAIADMDAASVWVGTFGITRSFCCLVVLILIQDGRPLLSVSG